MGIPCLPPVPVLLPPPLTLCPAKAAGIASAGVRAEPLGTCGCTRKKESSSMLSELSSVLTPVSFQPFVTVVRIKTLEDCPKGVFIC